MKKAVKAYNHVSTTSATECSNKNHSAAFPEELPAWFIKLFTKEFIELFCDCDNDGKINWKKLIEYNSGTVR